MAWGTDVPTGEVTDFRKAVQATPDETVVFGWVEWPDKATRDAGFAKAMKDERMPKAMPFDGKRMIFGGFTPVVEERGGGGGALGFVDAFVAAISPVKKDAFIKMSQDGAVGFLKGGALFDVECWGDDVAKGDTTDFYRATKAEGDEIPGLSFVGWPDKATRDAAWGEMMKEAAPVEMPFDGKRMFFGGFTTLVDLGGSHDQ